jgi:hypothetical protein
LLSCDRAYEVQRSHSDEEAFGRRTSAEAECLVEDASVERRKVVGTICDRPAQLLKSSVGKFHLGLDAHGAADLEASGALLEMLEQGCFTDACLAPQHKDPGSPVLCLLEKRVQSLQFR